ncbi:MULTISPECIES: hypothetical protein [Enterococcus]|nr:MULTISPECIES: hypothetical protein [Enterococcus]MDA3964364.1 hypothetical protein [Enterococcus thailandicus]OTP22921.1 hypothetical protein A5800_000737 [Enterococcus sp. 5B7_DIV0075]
MKKLDSRYIMGIFLVLFISIGIIEFIWKENHSFTLNEIYFRVLIVGSIMIELLPINKDWGTLKSLFFIFLSDYLLKKLFDFLGLEEITFKLIPYIVVLGILLIVFVARLTIKSKKESPTYLKKE